MTHLSVIRLLWMSFLKGFEDAMALLNTKCVIDECILFGSLAGPYSFLCDMYQNLSAMKHIVLELTYLMKLGYE